MQTLKRTKLLETIAQLASQLEIKCYLVGGYLRDQLRGVDSFDLDFSVSDRLPELLESLAKQLNSEYRYYPEFLTASVKLNPIWKQDIQMSNLDFCEFRQEVYPVAGSLPKISSGSFESDLMRRDFTINTLAVELSLYLKFLENKSSFACLEQILINLHGGIRDLDQGTIATLHSKSFWDDPTRIFRAARYKTLISGSYQRATREQLTQALGEQVLESMESYRIAGELLKIAESPLSQETFIELSQIGVFAAIWKSSTVIDSALLSKSLKHVLLGNDLEENLINLLTPIVSAYQANNHLKSLGLKNRIAKQILERI